MDGEGDGEEEGLPIARRENPSTPKYAVPSPPIAGEDSMGEPTLCDQANAPFPTANAANVPFKFPMNRIPLEPIAGMQAKPAVKAYDHCNAPVASKARRIPSLDPITMTDDGYAAIAGEASTAPPVR